jgi:hypothetical protein
MRFATISTIFLFIILIFPAHAFTQNWQQLGQSICRGPRVLYTDTITNRLYIAGDFMKADTHTVFGVCYWDGSSFGKLGESMWYTPWGNGCNATPIFDITRYKNLMVIGTSEDIIGGDNIKGIGGFDGTAWHPFGITDSTSLWSDHGIPLCGGFLSHNDTLYVGGIFSMANQDTCNSIAMWDGNAWYGLGFPEGNNGLPQIGKIVYYKNELYAGGNFTNTINGQFNMDILRYDGAYWKMAGPGLLGGSSWIHDMLVYKDELYICGYFKSSEGNIGNKIMRWNGTEWRDVGGGFCAPNHIATDMMVYNDKLYVVGIFNCVGNNLPVNNIAVWDGISWCSFGNSTFDNKLTAIAAYNGEIYIAGGFDTIDGQPIKCLAKYIGDHSEDICESVTSTEPASNDGIRNLRATLHPNPTATDTWVSLSGAKGSVRYTCYNSVGSVVRSGTFEQAGGMLSLEETAHGMYYLCLIDVSGQQTIIKVLRE